MRVLEEHPRREIHVKMEAMLNNLNIPFVDLLDVYRSEKREKIILKSYDPHPSPYGHTVAAKALFDFLAERQIVPVISG